MVMICSDVATRKLDFDSETVTGLASEVEASLELSNE